MSNSTTKKPTSVMNQLLTRACKENKVRHFSYEDASTIIERMGLTELDEQTDGLVFRTNGVPVILFNGDQSATARFYTVAHELGHIMLGHLDERGKRDAEYTEMEANIFASVFIAMSLFFDSMLKEGFTMEATTV